MPKLQVAKDIDIFYQEDDFTNPWQHRPTLLLQHGNGRSSAFWYRWIPYLSRHFKIVRADMRGVGQSSPIENTQDDISIEHCVSDLVQLIQHLSDAPVYFCGESMGGILGMALASLHPERVKALILVATPVYISDAMKSRYAMGHGSRLDAMKKMGIKNWVRETSVLTRFAPDTDPHLIDWYVDEFAKGQPDVLVRYSELVNSANAKDFLARIQCPTLAIMPSNGQITDTEQEALIEKHIQNIRIEHIQTPFHMIHLTHVKECTDQVLDFLEAMERQSCTQAN
jgi:3-oxoadipate enol-lactonase